MENTTFIGQVNDLMAVMDSVLLKKVNNNTNFKIFLRIQEIALVKKIKYGGVMIDHTLNLKHYTRKT